MTEKPSRTSLEIAGEWLTEGTGKLVDLATLLDEQYKAGEAKGMDRVRESLEALYRRYKRTGRQPMDFGRRESVDTIRALKPEGRR